MNDILELMKWLIENYATIGALLAGVYGIVNYFKELKESRKLETKKQKLIALKEIIPACVRVVDDMAHLVGAEKVTAFIDKVEAALKAHGYDLLPEEKEGLAILGSAEHKANKKDVK